MYISRENMKSDELVSYSIKCKLKCIDTVYMLC